MYSSVSFSTHGRLVSNTYPIHVLHSDREFLAGGLLKGLPEHRNDFSLSSADKEIVILQRNVDNEEII